MIDSIDPHLLTPPAPAEKPIDSEGAFDKELARWVVKELTAPLFKEGSPLEGAAHLQSLFQDALSDRLVDSLPNGAVERSGGLRRQGPAPGLDHDHGHDVRISSGFGMRMDPLNGSKRLHAGIDLAAPRGTPVRSARPGVVTFAGKQGGYGNLVIIDHGGGLETRYAHLSRLDVRAGDAIPAGEGIGAVGSTGRSTGPHLHFETRMGGRAVDPLDHVPDFATQVIGSSGR